MEINDYSALVGILKAGILVYGSLIWGTMAIIVIGLFRIATALEKANGDR